MNVVNKNGFSLVEVVAAAIIFVIAMGGVFSIVNSVVQQQENSGTTMQKVKGVMYAQRVIDNLRKDPSTLSTGTCDQSFVDPDGRTYTIDCDITEEADGSYSITTESSW